MPRLSQNRRTANRAAIVDAARRCFARNGYHQTSMPQIAAEAGISTGAPYRYFSGKEDLVVEVAQLAFESVFTPIMRLVEESDEITVGDLVGRAAQALTPPTGAGAAEQAELLRCGVDAWGELLRNDHLRAHAIEGLDRTVEHLAQALRRGQANGSVPDDLDPGNTARIIVAFVHGLMLQRAAFGLTDVESLVREARTLTGQSGQRRGDRAGVEE
ncbi:TetR/AcrR family transcriptional regulator [Amycolatopsis orientalis]|uniref:TetR/AcrR family transcriptional regulator n=1 Tax=Amycolatopsis orientalis TaxID=31958 RepID=UPI00039A16B6|nr:TetR/AcrR family transcriptional regulator [Amycolatopsis orientalis]